LNLPKVSGGAEFSLDEFVALLVKGDHSACESSILFLEQQGMSLEDLYEKILKQSLYKIGELWQVHKVSDEYPIE
jgi:hypothetical protein